MVAEVYQWNEFNQNNKLQNTTYSFRCKLYLNLPKRIGISFYCDVPFQKSKIKQERIGIFLSVNLSGKNYIKGIYNDFRIKQEEWVPLIRKKTFKTIYSFYF